MQQTPAPARHAAVRHVAPYLAAAVAGLVFGASDQFLGSISSWPAAGTLSLMSAPWLLLPFAVGCSQLEASRAAVMGMMATVAAVAGYAVMIMSPVEGVHGQSARLVLAVFSSQTRWLLAALLAGPIYGVLGQRWRTTRSLASGLVAAAPLLLEPATRALHLEWGPPTVFLIELGVGVLAAGYFVSAIRRARKLPPEAAG